MYFFFFQAEDGIRDIGVTGVQTCALPILQGVQVALGPAAGLAFALFGGKPGSAELHRGLRQLGRELAIAGDRKSVVEGKSVDLGGRRIIKKNKRTAEKPYVQLSIRLEYSH